MPDEELQGFGLSDDDALDAAESDEVQDNNVVSLDDLGDEEMEDDPDMDSFDDVDDF